MKKILASMTACVCLCAPAQDRADQQHLDTPDSFSMILLGDPQGYIKYDINQPLFELQTAWIADNIDNLNIKAVLCTGDLVEQNDNLVRNRRMLNQTSREMWQEVARAFARLDNKVPYIISPATTSMATAPRRTATPTSPNISPSSATRRGTTAPWPSSPTAPA